MSIKSTTYTKKDIIKKMSYKVNINDDESRILIDCLMEIFTEMFLAPNDTTRIELRDFGVFKVYKTKQRTNARNPLTKEEVTIPPRKRIVFKPGKKIQKSLKEEVSN